MIISIIINNNIIITTIIPSSTHESLVDALTWRSFSPADFPRNISLASAACAGGVRGVFEDGEDARTRASMR
eukprot:6648251-Pyramimonas_sp.AAC.1